MISPFISFIIPLYNHLKETKEMLDSLLNSLPAGLEYEIILVDDFSTDGTREWMQSVQAKNIITIKNAKNMGYAATNNVGVIEAKGSLIGLLNNDLLFPKGWFEPMLEILLDDTLNTAIVGNVQYRVVDGALDHAGVYLNANAQFDHIRETFDLTQKYKKLSVVTGACMLMKKADFEVVGGFDENFVNGCEDIDLCLKMQKLGKHNYVALQSRIKHHVSLSRGKVSKTNEQNSRYLYEKYRDTIKRENADFWAKILQSNKEYVTTFFGQINQEVLATPFTLSKIIAESMISKEEHRWSRELDDCDLNADIAKKYTTKGLLYDEKYGGWTFSGSFELKFKDVSSFRDFYVCGYTLFEPEQNPISITISINEIQKQTFYINSGKNINIGIVNPLLLKDIDNNFKVETHFVDDNKKIIITHFVIDDKIVDRKAGSEFYFLLL